MKNPLTDNRHYENMPFEIPESWEWATVKEISSSILYGISEAAKTEGKYKLLRITDIQNNTVDWNKVPYTDYDTENVEKYLLQDDDILFARTGATVGKSYLVKGIVEQSVYASYLIRVKASREVFPQYIKIFFESGYYWEQIGDKSVGTGQPNVNGTLLGELKIPIPPYREQQHIVSKIEGIFVYVDEVDAYKNDLQNTVNLTKNKILELAIQGSLVPQDPNEEPAINPLKRINPDFTPSDNPHYENIPSNWQVVPMNLLCELTDGDRQSGTKKINLDVKYLRGKGEEAILSAGKYVPAGSTMILVDGENSGEIFTTPVEGYQGSTFKLLKISKEIYKPFILYVIKSHQKRFRENKVGSAIPHLNKKLFKEIDVLLPPFEEQQRIVKRIEEIFTSLDEITEEL